MPDQPLWQILVVSLTAYSGRNGALLTLVVQVRRCELMLVARRKGH